MVELGVVLSLCVCVPLVVCGPAAWLLLFGGRVGIALTAMGGGWVGGYVRVRFLFSFWCVFFLVFCFLFFFPSSGVSFFLPFSSIILELKPFSRVPPLPSLSELVSLYALNAVAVFVLPHYAIFSCRQKSPQAFLTPQAFALSRRGLPRFRDVMSGVMSDVTWTELFLLGERQAGRVGCRRILSLEGQGSDFLRRGDRFQEKRGRHGEGGMGGCDNLVGLNWIGEGCVVVFFAGWEVRLREAAITTYLVMQYLSRGEVFSLVGEEG